MSVELVVLVKVAVEILGSSHIFFLLTVDRFDFHVTTQNLNPPTPSSPDEMTGAVGEPQHVKMTGNQSESTVSTPPSVSQTCEIAAGKANQRKAAGLDEDLYLMIANVYLILDDVTNRPACVKQAAILRV